jgi:FtsH-binding integral membrane protein
MKKLGIKKIISLVIGITGFGMVLSVLIKGAVTGAVIGSNANSKFIGAFGIVLMIIAIVIERYNIKHKKEVEEDQ